MSDNRLVLVLNAGSSSLKYQLLQPDSGDLAAKGIVERIGEGEVADHRAALTMVFDTLSDEGIDLRSGDVAAVGHRVVHGGTIFHRPTIITDEMVAELQRLSSLAPLHNPANITGIEVARELLPNLPQVAVFDTAFFYDLPAAAATYAIDAQLAQQYEIRRYGFHGTSHEYVSRQAAATLGRESTDINQIVLHLGNGASASAVQGGRAVETSMGMTPLEGLVMGTRGGDIDPGILLYLNRFADMSVDDLDALLNRNSGLKGLCGENDFRALGQLRNEGNADAQLAYEVFVHRLRKYIGAYLVTLGRVDAISFTAGVGENDPQVRADALAGLELYGITLDPDRNAQRGDGARVISTDGSPVTVLVVPTNEELAIARATADTVSG